MSRTWKKFLNEAKEFVSRDEVVVLGAGVGAVVGAFVLGWVAREWVDRRAGGADHGSP